MIGTLLDAGVTDAMPAAQVRRLRVTNIVALVGVGSLAVWAGLSLPSGQWLNASENLGMAGVFGVVLFLNRTGRWSAASALVLLATHLQLLWALWLFGYRSGSSLYYALLLVGPYLVFGRERRGVAHGAAAGALLLWVLSTLYLDQLPQRIFLMSLPANELVNTVILGVVLVLMAWGFAEAVDSAEDSLDAERERADRLLLNVLPPSIADRLKREPNEVVADRFDEATFLFADLVGFTPMSARLPPEEMVALLNEVFTEFDAICHRHGVEKIRTIGDGYMAVCGAPVPNQDHAVVMARAAVEMRDYIAGRVGTPLQIRIGLNSGPAIGAIVGTSRFHWDVWGDAVNVAARMESTGEAGRIQVARSSYERIRDELPCESRGRIAIKGKGELETWFIV